MKKICVLLCLVLISCFVLSSCEKGDDSVTLYVYNWGEYISDGSEDSLDVNKAFEDYYYEMTGTKVVVNYSTFPSNEEMYTKVDSGSATYDVLIPSDYMIERMVRENKLHPLNLDNIPNYNYVSEKFKGENIYYECHSEELYSIPYMYGMIGVIYNTERVPDDNPNVVNKNWGLMWDEAFSGDILQYNNSRDAFGTAMYKLGISVNTDDEDEWRAALEELKAQKPLVQGYVMDEIFNKMGDGSAAVASYYAGDFFTMYEDNDALAFYYPTEGTNSYVDAMCIPANAKNPEIAEAYINFMCRPDIALANAEATYYASPLDMDLVAADYPEEYAEYQECMNDVHEDAYEILYGEEAQNTKSEPYMNLSEDKLQLINDLWEELKVESSVSWGIYALFGAIAVAIGVGVFFVIRKKRRNKALDLAD